jgi:hypothetical protein
MGRDELAEAIRARRREDVVPARRRPRPGPGAGTGRGWRRRGRKAISWVTTSMVRPSSAKRAHDAQHLADQFRIERRGRLVEQHDLRVHGERTGDRGALLLTAREMARGSGRACRRCRPWPAAPAASAIAAFRLRPLLHMDRRLDDVFEHRHVGPEIEALEHHGDIRAQARMQLDLGPAGRRPWRPFPVGFQADRLACDAPPRPRSGTLEQVDAAQHASTCRTRRRRGSEMTSPSAAHRSEMPFSTSSAPKRLRRLRTETAGVVAAVRWLQVQAWCNAAPVDTVGACRGRLGRQAPLDASATRPRDDEVDARGR